MRPRFSILQMLELTTIVGVTLAMDAAFPLFAFQSGFSHIPLVVMTLGSLSGTYLAFRWAREHTFLSLVEGAVIWSALLTLLNAIRVGVWVAEVLRTRYDYFDWRTEWLELASISLGVTFLATIASVSLTVVIHAAEIVIARWR